MCVEYQQREELRDCIQDTCRHFSLACHKLVQSLECASNVSLLFRVVVFSCSILLHCQMPKLAVVSHDAAQDRADAVEATGVPIVDVSIH